MARELVIAALKSIVADLEDFKERWNADGDVLYEFLAAEWDESKKINDFIPKIESDYSGMEGILDRIQGAYGVPISSMRDDAADVVYRTVEENQQGTFGYYKDFFWMFPNEKENEVINKLYEELHRAYQAEYESSIGVFDMPHKTPEELYEMLDLPMKHLAH